MSMNIRENEAYAEKELKVDPPNCPKKGGWYVAWHFNKPPESVFIIQRHLTNHRKSVPKGPFKPEMAGRTEGGWSVVDLGEKGWYSQNAIPHNKPIPWTGDVSCLLSQPLGYEHTLRGAFEALLAVGRISQKQYDEAVAWLDEERRQYNLRDKLLDAVKLLEAHDYTVIKNKPKKE